MRRRIPLLFLLVLSQLPIDGYSLNLGSLTVATDKPAYYIELDNIQINGTLKQDGIPVSDGIVALEICNPFNQLVVLRTLRTGTAAVSGTPIEITRLVLCDEQGNPKNYAVEGAPTYVGVTAKNVGNETIPKVVVVLNLCQELYSLSWASLGVSPLSQDGCLVFYISVSIPSRVSLGNVTIYASALSNYPHLGGYPLSSEKFLTFSVADPLEPPQGTPTFGTSPPSNTNGTYNTVLKIPLEAELEGFKQGHYVIYVSTCYKSKQAANTTIILVKMPGDVDLDGDVDSTDVFSYMVIAYGSAYGDARYNWQCDFDDDGDVDPTDVFIYQAPFYGKTA